VTQINLGSEANPKPIFIRESLSPSEKENLIHLIREYIGVFAWELANLPYAVNQLGVYGFSKKN